jgi:hypothetical protein
MYPPTVFISYSHKDETEKDQLLSHLGVLQKAGLIKVWVDDRISGGADWEEEIRQAMGRANVAILLVSANFLNSDFILGKEIPNLLARRRKEGVTVFPVIAKACSWKKVGWLTQMNVRPRGGAPVWGEGGLHADKHLAAIVDEIADLIERVNRDPERTIRLQLLSKEAQAVLQACLERSQAGLRRRLPAELHLQAEAQLETLRQALSTDPPDLMEIEAVLRSAKNDALLFNHLQLFLREPALQRLARRAGQQDHYERLAFAQDG